MEPIIFIYFKNIFKIYMTTLQITGNNNFKFITYNYDPGLVNSINTVNSSIAKNSVRDIINGSTTAHPNCLC